MKTAAGAAMGGGGAPEGPIVGRQRAIIRDLYALHATRAAEEADIREKFQAAQATAQREHRAAMAAADRLHTDERDATMSQTGDALARIERERSENTAEAERVADREASMLRERAAHDEATAKKDYQETTWLAETMFDTSKDKPRIEYELLAKDLDAKAGQLGMVEQGAAFWLRKYNMPQIPEPLPPGLRPEGEVVDDLAEFDAARAEARRLHDLLGALRLPRFFQYGLPVTMVLVAAIVVGGATGWYAWKYKISAWFVLGGALAGAVLASPLVFGLMSRAAERRVLAITKPMAEQLARARAAHERALARADKKRRNTEAAIRQRRDTEIAKAKTTYNTLSREIRHRIEKAVAKVEATRAGTLASFSERHTRSSSEKQDERSKRLMTTEERHAAATAAAQAGLDTAMRDAQIEHDSRFSALQQTWTDGISRILSEVAVETREIDAPNPDWSDPAWSAFDPPTSMAPGVRVGHWRLDLAQVPGGVSPDPRLAAPCGGVLSLPAVIEPSTNASLLLEAPPEGRERAIATLRAVMLRLLTTIPPGKVRFTIVDPVGLGQNFAGFMHLADYEAALVADRIWTDPRHIEQRLTDLTEHMENVIQKYLRNEYPTIDAYNRHAGEVAEPYRFLVLADFPAGLNEAAAKRLASIVASGPRCGVYALIAADTRQRPPQGLHMADLEKACTTLTWRDGRFLRNDPDFARPGLTLELDDAPQDDFLTRILKTIGPASKDATRVQVPFEVTAPPPDKRWTLDSSLDLRVPLGKSGATKVQHLTLGRGTSQHVLIAGRTGSGKSTLLHVLITNLALWYDPTQVELYLVDFKKGVEFKAYATANTPHARVIAIESEREFGLSVLRRLDAELKRRGEMYRDAGIQDLAGFRRERPGVVMPRTLLIVDEFQELFVEDDKLAQEAALLLDRLVRQGRAFGMHVILGSQTLGGAYSLARSTIGQMAIRIALQCSEADSYLILSDDNPAARLLSRPGEAIYNDQSGMLEGNSPFQIVWLPDEVRDRQLGIVESTAKDKLTARPEPAIVFEGNVPADLRANHLLRVLLDRNEWGTPSPVARVWLGEPISIKDPTCAELRRQSGGNLVIVGQRDESALAMMISGLVGLAAQNRAAEFFVLDGTPAETPTAGILDKVAALLPQGSGVRTVAYRDVPVAMTDLAVELDRRAAGEHTDSSEPPVFVLINGLQRYRMLRKAEDEYSFSADPDKPPTPDKVLHRLLTEGPPVGIHVLIWCDTVTNLERTLQRGAVREFDSRVLFQMSPTDSSALIDGPHAGVVGQHRALYHSEEQGILEKFRPYALPAMDWIAQVIERLKARP